MNRCLQRDPLEQRNNSEFEQNDLLNPDAVKINDSESEILWKHGNHTGFL